MPRPTEAKAAVLSHAASCDHPRRPCDCGVQERDEERDRLMAEVDTLRAEKSMQAQLLVKTAKERDDARQIIETMNEEIARLMGLRQREALEIGALKEEVRMLRFGSLDSAKDSAALKGLRVMGPPHLVGYAEHVLELLESQLERAKELQAGAEAQAARAIGQRELIIDRLRRRGIIVELVEAER